MSEEADEFIIIWLFKQCVDLNVADASPFPLIVQKFSTKLFLKKMCRTWTNCLALVSHLARRYQGKIYFLCVSGSCPVSSGGTGTAFVIVDFVLFQTSLHSPSSCVLSFINTEKDRNVRRRDENWRKYELFVACFNLLDLLKLAWVHWINEWKT